MARPHLVLVRDAPAETAPRRPLLRRRERETPPPGRTVVLEPAFGRWHLDPNCAVLRAQPAVATVVAAAPEAVARGCSLCTAVRL